jgi:hypothetical protein
MRALVVVVAVIAFGLSATHTAPASGSETSGGLLRAAVRQAPAAIRGTDARRHLVYEIALRNVARSDVRVLGLEVRGRSRGAPLAAYGAAEIEGIMVGPDRGTPTSTLAAGQRGFIFLDLSLRPGGHVPRRLLHRFTLSVGGRDVTFSGARSRVDRRAPVRLSPPLRGENLVVIGCCGAVLGHRRALLEIEPGTLTLSQRYAIDFVRVDDELSTSAGDPTRNASYLIFGDEVLAAASGRVVATRNDVAEGTPPDETPFTTWEDVTGNSVTQDLGDGRFAVYAHMQPGSVRVRPGDHVRRGQVLGLVGNTGISSEPHLHFHVMDGPGGPSHVAAEGLPFVFDGFDITAHVSGLEDDPPAPVPAPAPPPRHRTGEYPFTGDVIAFPGVPRMKVRALQAISGPSPFAAGCPGALFDDAHIAGAEIEPFITVSLARPRDIVATWQQDLGPAGRADLIGASHDGGRTWSRVTIPGTSRCTGGTADAASDPWLSAGGDGRVYFIGSAAFFASDPPPVAFLASASRDGGRSWSAPSTVAPADDRNDKPTITAHPRRAGRAYAIWGNWEHEFSRFPYTNFLRFSRTRDGAGTWSAPVVVDAPPPDSADVGGKIVVLHDGSLLALFARTTLHQDFTADDTQFATRSSDDGRTWSPPVAIASQATGRFADEAGTELSNVDMFGTSVALAPDGTVYAAWDHDTSATTGAIDIVSSRDGGRTWSGPTALPGPGAFAFEPSLAVNERGILGVLWYDHRNDRPRDAELTTDVWFASSDDGGSHWRQLHVAGRFDFRTAPRGRIGEYQGLAATGKDFAAAFTMTEPAAVDGPSDIFFARIGR